MPEINTLGAVIKTTYEGQPDTNPFTDSAVATLAALTVFDDETFDPTAIDLSGNSAPDYTQIGAVQLALDGGVTPVNGALAWIAWTGDGSAVTCDGVTVKWPDGTSGAKTWTGQRPLAVVYHPALGHAVALLDGAGDFATAAQGAKADTALQPAAIGSTVQAWDADLDALAALTDPATKLAGIEAGADVTDATNVAAAGAHMSGGTDVPVADGGTGVSTLGSGNVLVGAGTAPVTSTKAAPSGDFVGTSDTQTLTGKTLGATDVTGRLSVNETVPRARVLALPQSLAATDNGKIISFTNAGTLTVPAAGTLCPNTDDAFACLLIATGGDVLVDGPGGTNVTIPNGNCGAVLSRNGGATRAIAGAATAIIS